MKRARGFDEVMIVNPYDPRHGEGARLMQFHQVGWPGYGQYADPYAGYGFAGYGYADPYGYGEPYGYAGYGYAGPYAYAADPYAYALPYGYGYPEDTQAYAGYGEYAEPYGYYADPYGYPETPPDQFDGYAEDETVGYYPQDDPFNGYAAEPEDAMAGGAYADPYGEDPAPYDAMNGYAAEGDELAGGDYAGYVRSRRDRCAAGCMAPTGVAGPEDGAFDGYTAPAGAGASCGDFRPGPDATAEVPDTFRPPW